MSGPGSAAPKLMPRRTGDDDELGTMQLTSTSGKRGDTSSFTYLLYHRRSPGAPPNTLGTVGDLALDGAGTVFLHLVTGWEPWNGIQVGHGRQKHPEHGEYVLDRTAMKWVTGATLIRNRRKYKKAKEQADGGGAAVKLEDSGDIELGPEPGTSGSKRRKVDTGKATNSSTSPTVEESESPDPALILTAVPSLAPIPPIDAPNNTDSTHNEVMVQETVTAPIPTTSQNNAAIQNNITGQSVASLPNSVPAPSAAIQKSAPAPNNVAAQISGPSTQHNAHSLRPQLQNLNLNAAASAPPKPILLSPVGYPSFLLPTDVLPANMWLREIFSDTQYLHYLHPNRIALQEMLQPLLKLPYPLRTYSKTCHRREFTNSTRAAALDARSVGIDLVQWSAFLLARDRMMPCLTLVDGHLRHIHPADLFAHVNISDSEALKRNWTILMPIDVPFYSAGSLRCRLCLPSKFHAEAVPRPLRPVDPEQHLVTWMTSWSRSGALSHVNVDHTGLAKVILGAGSCNKLWLAWRPTPKNLHLWRRFHGRPSTLQTTMTAIQHMEGLSILRLRSIDDNAVILTPGTLYVEISLNSCAYSHVLICRLDDWNDAHEFLRWELAWCKENLVVLPEVVEPHVLDIKVSLDAWQKTARKAGRQQMLDEIASLRELAQSIPISPPDTPQR